MSAVTQFGVGAIWDHDGESFVQADISRWSDNGHDIVLDRLARSIGVSGFRAPNAVDDGAGLPFFRFPEWLFCPTCRSMSRYDKHKPETRPRCLKCSTSSPLVPIRFVAICEDGHLFDIDWSFWAHKDSNQPGENCHSRDNLKWQSLSGGIGLEGLSVKCDACESRNTLKDITRFPHRCSGRQPWQPPEASVPCSATTYGVQRGASNAWFGAITSAIDIPPESDFIEIDIVMPSITKDDNFKSLVDQEPGGYFENKQIAQIASRHKVSESEVRQLLERARDTQRGIVPQAKLNPESLRIGEWRALTGADTKDSRSRFVIEAMDLAGQVNSMGVAQIPSIANSIERLVAVRKVHEVRALRGFTRFKPEADQPTIVPASLDPSVTWLPAYEVFGEGIFVTFNEDALSEWESRPAVIAKVGELTASVKDSYASSNNVSVNNPRLYLLHTISHMLIRQLSFDCGYPAASLRERLYATEIDSNIPMAGILIYTADADAEGSMGGLVRQSRPADFLLTISRALSHADWCSLDPICGESRSGPHGVNQAACHACCLAPETACELFNRHLDRSLIINQDSNISFLE